jgi:GTPase SAR1 family protein
MSRFEKDNRQKYLNEIIGNLEEYSYRSKRYHINYAIALCFCTKDININELVTIKRKTDRYITLESNLCCVVFDCIDAESSKRAAQNLKTEVEENCLGQDFFLHVATSLEYESQLKLTNSLFVKLDGFLDDLKAEDNLVING